MDSPPGWIHGKWCDAKGSVGRNCFQPSRIAGLEGSNRSTWPRKDSSEKASQRASQAACKFEQREAVPRKENTWNRKQVCGSSAAQVWPGSFSLLSPPDPFFSLWCLLGLHCRLSNCWDFTLPTAITILKAFSCCKRTGLQPILLSLGRMNAADHNRWNTGHHQYKERLDVLEGQTTQSRCWLYPWAYCLDEQDWCCHWCTS